MTIKTFEVPNISCQGCVQAIKNELAELPGVANIEGDAKTRAIQVEFEAPASRDVIAAALKAIDYPPAT